MKVTSKITGKTYDPDQVWYITNMSQIAFYFEQGVGEEILDILYDRSRVQKNRLCMVYPKSPQMSVVFDLWMRKAKKPDADPK